MTQAWLIRDRAKRRADRAVRYDPLLKLIPATPQGTVGEALAVAASRRADKIRKEATRR